MDRQDFSRMSSQIFIFIAQVAILIFCFVFVDFIYQNDILPDKEVKEDFTQTNCVLLTKQMATKGRLVHRYRANFLVSYTVNEVTYKTWVTGNGLDQAYFSDESHEQDLLDQFAVNTSYPCWINPNVPQIAVLVLRQNWTSTLPLLVPTLIGFIAAYYVLRTLFNLFVFFYFRKQKPGKDKNQSPR